MGTAASCGGTTSIRRGCWKGWRAREQADCLARLPVAELAPHTDTALPGSMGGSRRVGFPFLVS